MTDKVSAWARLLDWADEWLQIAMVAAAVVFVALWYAGSTLQAGALREALLDIGPIGFLLATVIGAFAPVLLLLFRPKPISKGSTKSGKGGPA